MELCLLNLLILIDCFLCNSYPCVLFESLSHVINQESHVYSWNLGKIYLVYFLKFWNLPRLTREISKFKKSEVGKFIPNFPLKHVITSTNHTIDCNWHCTVNVLFCNCPLFCKSPLADLKLPSVNWHFFTNRQNMRHFLKMIH